MRLHGGQLFLLPPLTLTHIICRKTDDLNELPVLVLLLSILCVDVTAFRLNRNNALKHNKRGKIKKKMLIRICTAECFRLGDGLARQRSNSLRTLAADCSRPVCRNQWSNYGGAWGGLAHLKDLAAPRNICFERVQGACKRPPEIARWSPIIYKCFIAICKYFLYWNCSTKTFWSPEMWLLEGPRGPQKIF